MITTVNADKVAPEKRILYLFRNDVYGFSFRLEEFLVFLTSPGFLSALDESRAYVWSVKYAQSKSSSVHSKAPIEVSKVPEEQDKEKEKEEEDYSDSDDEDFEDSTIDEDGTTDTADEADVEEEATPPPAKKVCTEPHPVVGGGDAGDPEAGEVCTH
jgi:cytoskeletal protein RodZ